MFRIKMANFTANYNYLIAIVSALQKSLLELEVRKFRIKRNNNNNNKRRNESEAVKHPTPTAEITCT